LTKSNIVQYMNTTDHSILLSKTLIHVIMIDSHRKQKFSEYLPEFYDVLKSTCIVLSKLP
jgi:hypothetical protein